MKSSENENAYFLKKRRISFFLLGFINIFGKNRLFYVSFSMFRKIHAEEFFKHIGERKKTSRCFFVNICV